MSMSTKHKISFETSKTNIPVSKILELLSTQYDDTEFVYESCYEGAWSKDSSEPWVTVVYKHGTTQK